MKSIIFITNRLVLMLIFVLTMTVVNPAMAQTEEEEDDQEFFDDGLNTDKFSSSFDDTYSHDRPDYKARQKKIDNSDDEVEADVKQFDMDVDRHFRANEPRTALGEGGGASNYSHAKDANQIVNPGVVGSINPPAKKDGPGSYVPDNGGDPDVPVDGGILGLALSGIAFGALKRKKNQNK